MIVMNLQLRHDQTAHEAVNKDDNKEIEKYKYDQADNLPEVVV